MLNKSQNKKFSVLNNSSGLNENMQPPLYMVPQNSIINMRQKGGGIAEFNLQENSANQLKPISNSCQHCENMAKNFLYLESLIRTNYDEKKKQCSVCDSSLAYLQYVNKGILEVFGNFDCIAEASKAFIKTEKQKGEIEKKKLLRTKIERLKSVDHQGIEKIRKHKSKGLKNTKITKIMQVASKGSNLSLGISTVRKPVKKLKRRNIGRLHVFRSQDSQTTKKSVSKRKKLNQDHLNTQ
ncbi:uncharacterized protein LOC142219596 [Haematobia irritans]|uniref:uncharacterized protein LOC142219596 n=1 Tax=Haematobia irritans TaxID=7368 RepID=UPI003F4F7151